MSFESGEVKGSATTTIIAGIDISIIGYEVFDHIQMTLLSSDVDGSVAIIIIIVDSSIVGDEVCNH